MLVIQVWIWYLKLNILVAAIKIPKIGRAANIILGYLRRPGMWINPAPLSAA
jgi:hypothetical protein